MACVKLGEKRRYYMTPLISVTLKVTIAVPDDTFDGNKLFVEITGSKEVCEELLKNTQETNNFLSSHVKVEVVKCFCYFS